MRKWLWLCVGALAACAAGLAPFGASAPYVARYPDPIAVEVPRNAPSITQQFRAPDTHSPRGQEWGEHAGIDIHTDVGTPVLAAASGKVDQSFFDPAYGNVVLIAHGGSPRRWTRYAHMDSRLVSRGQSVARGAQIGTLGKTGALAGGFPHLHFELWQDMPGQGRVAIDPHRKWAGGVGKVSCLGAPISGGFALTYPVACR